MSTLDCNKQLKILLRIACRASRMLGSKTFSFTSRKLTKHQHTKLCIIGGGLAAHTAAIYAARAQLEPILFEGYAKSHDTTPGGQISSPILVENFPGFPDGIRGEELAERIRNQSLRFGTSIFTKIVTKVDFSTTPFKIFTNSQTFLADSVIIATGASRKKLHFPGSNEFWNRGISAYALYDGVAPMFKDKPLAVIGGGDLAMEEGIFLSNYASKVYIIHRRNKLRASKIMQRRALENPKIEVIWNSVVVEAYGKDILRGIKVKNVVSKEATEVEVFGLFLSIGHEPTTRFLDGQLELDADGYILTKLGTTETSMPGIFAAGEVQDKKYRQAITAAASGCMAALDAEHYLMEMEP